MKYAFALSLQTHKRPLGGADTKTVGTGVYLKAIKTNTAAKRVAWNPEATTPLKQCIDFQPHVGRPNPQFFIYQSNVKSRTASQYRFQTPVLQNHSPAVGPGDLFFFPPFFETQKLKYFLAKCNSVATLTLTLDV